MLNAVPGRQEAPIRSPRSEFSCGQRGKRGSKIKQACKIYGCVRLWIVGRAGEIQLLKPQHHVGMIQHPQEVENEAGVQGKSTEAIQ